MVLGWAPCHARSRHGRSRPIPCRRWGAAASVWSNSTGGAATEAKWGIVPVLLRPRGKHRKKLLYLSASERPLSGLPRSQRKNSRPLHGSGSRSRSRGVGSNADASLLNLPRWSAGGAFSVQRPRRASSSNLRQADSPPRDSKSRDTSGPVATFPRDGRACETTG